MFGSLNKPQKVQTSQHYLAFTKLEKERAQNKEADSRQRWKPILSHNQLTALHLSQVSPESKKRTLEGNKRKAKQSQC